LEEAMLGMVTIKSLQRIAWIAVLGSLLLGISLVLYLFDPTYHSFYPRCLFHQMTGLFCPGCGSLRSFHQLLHGRLVSALHFNALLVLSLPLGVWMAARRWLDRLIGRPPSDLFRPYMLWIGLALVLLFGLLRNFSFAHGWLAP
jgi:hypothetical protein